MWQRKHSLIFVALLIAAACFRVSVAHWLANDNPDDGRVYAQIARNLVEQHVYSQDAEPPYEPTLIRTPGYPLFIAAVYSVFGHTNNGAVRIAQALIDTATCALVAMLAFLWQPDDRRKTFTALSALAVAAVNPFTSIYSATILPEVPTIFLAVAMCITASIALRTDDSKRGLKFWCATGLLSGMAVLLRPDIGLFVAAIGLTLVTKTLTRFRGRLGNATVMAVVFSLAFVVPLAPWTIRNWRVFHLFQPLAPRHAEMPGEFIPHGYNRWLKTWLDDPQYIDPMEWELNVEPINIDDLPDSAFDSDAERDRVAELFDKYNHPQTQTSEPTPTEPQPSPTPQASPTPSSQNSPQPNANSNTGEESENEQGEENEEGQAETSEPNTSEHGPALMTPEIDAEFAQIAAERIKRHPFRYYLLLPAKRARALWFNTHSDFYPFEGTLLPLDDLDYEIHQHIWLPLFALLVGIYTLLGLAGGYVLWASRDFYARLWLLLVVLIIALRLAFFSSLENPEPRYVVEFFPFLAALGAIAITQLFKRKAEVKEANP